MRSSKDWYFSVFDHNTTSTRNRVTGLLQGHAKSLKMPVPYPQPNLALLLQDALIELMPT